MPWILVLAATVLLLCACRGPDTQAPAPAPAAAVAPGDTCSPQRRMAWAHYVPWYDPARTAHTARGFWDQPSAAALPDLRAEFAAAQAAGIDGFLVDVVGAPRPKATAFAEGVAGMLAAAEGTPFLVAACLDGGHGDLDWQAEEIARMAALFATHPNYPRVGGRPLFATYSALGRTPEQWRGIRERLRAKGLDPYLLGDLAGGFGQVDDAKVAEYAAVFDLLYVFAAYPHRPSAGAPALSTGERFQRLGAASAAAGRPWMPVLWPGYLGGWLNGRNDFHQPFRGLDVLWECAQALDPQRDAWVHLCTWNDHDETSLMPTAIGGGGKLALCAAALARWRGQEPPAQARVLAAYRREELVGSDLRIEVATLPGREGGALAVDGWLQGPDGARLAELPARTLAADAWAGAEWRIPTAGLAAAAAWTPVLRVRRDGQAGAPTILPAILPATGWLEDASTVVTALDACAAGQARLTVAEDGDALRARLDLQADEPVRSATLWRNDRCLAGFTPASAAPAPALLHLAIPTFRPHRLRLTVADGALVAADRRGGLKPGSWSAAGFDLRHEHDWNALTVTLATTPATVVRVQIDEQPAQAIDLARLAAGGTATCGTPAATAIARADYDPRGVAPGTDARAYDTALRCGPGRPGDRWCARVELQSGRVLWSPVQAPWAGAPRRLAVIDSALSLDATADASGTLGASGWLEPAPRPQQAVEALVHPAALRAARWSLAADGADLAGDRPLAALRAPAQARLLAADGPDGHPCLHFDGRSAVTLPRRVWPLGPCTLALALRPAAAPTGDQAVVTRKGWATGLNLRLRADGRAEVWRDGHGTPAVRVAGDRALEPGTWTVLRAVYDGTRLRLWQDGRLAGETAAPASQVHGNCTVTLGAAENGFAGALADLEVLGWAAPPP
jgi:hypothetical protein